MAAVHFSLPLPVLPEDWLGEKDFKSIGQLSSATQRNIEPVGPHFLAHARRVSHLSLIAFHTFAALNTNNLNRNDTNGPSLKTIGYKLKRM